MPSGIEREVGGADLEIAPTVYDALDGAHGMVVVVGTDWDEFGSLDLSRANEILAHSIVMDGRNMFDGANRRKAQGFVSYGYEIGWAARHLEGDRGSGVDASRPARRPPRARSGGFAQGLTSPKGEADSKSPLRQGV